MIQSLSISNYALISAVDIEFAAGFNIITGETGAGKSILLGALGLLLGGRADMNVMRDKTRKTVVEASFLLNGSQNNINAVLEAADIETNADRCVLRREINPRGGSRAFINDTPVTVALLRDVAVNLVDIHSQHQNLLLSTPEYQLSVLDALANNAEILQQYSQAYTEYRKALTEYKTSRDRLQKARQDEDYISYQLQQLEALDVKEGEQTQLEQRRDVLANATRVRQNLETAASNLLDSPNITAGISHAIDALAQIRDILPQLPELCKRLSVARIEMQDIAEEVSMLRSTVNGDPQELEQVEQRLSEIYALQSRHNVNTDKQLVEIRAKLQSQLQFISNGNYSLSEIEDKARKAKKIAVTIAREITNRRCSAAVKLANELQLRAQPMGLQNMRCEISVTQARLTETGIDAVDFLFAFNKNQELQSIGKTASGGEISRVILTLKSIMAEKMQMPTVIFDEVDTGVSGNIAVRMGVMMKEISSTTQVIAITHLPQVAACGVYHLKVFKEDDETSTNTRLRVLDRNERIQELALMLSGMPDDETALRTAEMLLDKASG